MTTPDQAAPGTDGGASTDIDTQAKNIAAATGQDVELVRSVLAAIDSQAGEALGVVRFDPETKAVAHRVKDGDVVKWRISHPTDGMSYEMTPTKSDWQLVES